MQHFSECSLKENNNLLSSLADFQLSVLPVFVYQNQDFPYLHDGILPTSTVEEKEADQGATTQWKVIPFKGDGEA